MISVKKNLLLCSMVECNFKGFKELQFWQWNIQYFIIQDVRRLHNTESIFSGMHFAV